MKHYAVILIIISVITVNCNIDRVKPRPHGYGWEICDKCDGYGYTYAVRPSKSSRGSAINMNEKKEFDDSVKTNRKVFIDDRTDDNPHSSENSTDSLNSGDSGRPAKRIYCTICNGAGWVRYR